MKKRFLPFLESLRTPENTRDIDRIKRAFLESTHDLDDELNTRYKEDGYDIDDYSTPRPRKNVMRTPPDYDESLSASNDFDAGDKELNVKDNYGEDLSLLNEDGEYDDSDDIIEMLPAGIACAVEGGTVDDYIQYYGDNGMNDLIQLDNFMKENGYSGFDIIDSESEFSSHPAFGLAGDVVKARMTEGEWRPMCQDYID